MLILSMRDLSGGNSIKSRYKFYLYWNVEVQSRIAIQIWSHCCSIAVILLVFWAHSISIKNYFGRKLCVRIDKMNDTR